MLRWLYPGMKVKRWLLLALLGLVMILGGIIFFLGFGPMAELTVMIYYFTRELPSLFWRIMGLAMLSLGLFFLGMGLRQMVHSLFEVLLPDSDSGLADVIFNKRVLEKGPKIVVIGGGTGLSILLRGIKEYTNNITAIVTVSDDGGSSGKLRDEMGILPPGDIRNCLVALADAEPLMQSLFQYRFSQGENLNGHSFGNLFIAAMTKISGDFETAINHSSKVLAVRGKVIPSTLTSSTLMAEYEDGDVGAGESNIPLAKKPIRRVFLQPDNCQPHPVALKEIQEADIIVLGPGSLYTSIVPPLLIEGISEAIQKTQAVKIYVCNVMTQPGETDGYTASKHLQVLKEHAGNSIADYAVVNNKVISSKAAQKYKSEDAYQVVVDLPELHKNGITVIEGPLVEEEPLVRHDPDKLARVIMEIALKVNGSKDNLLRWFMPHRST